MAPVSDFDVRQRSALVKMQDRKKIAAERKKLQTLQVSANDNTVLVGCHGIVLQNTQGEKSGKSLAAHDLKTSHHNFDHMPSSDNMPGKMTSEKLKCSQHTPNVVSADIVPFLPAQDENVRKSSLAGAKKSSNIAKPKKKTCKFNKTLKASTKHIKEHLQQPKTTLCSVSKQKLSSYGSDPEIASKSKGEASAVAEIEESSKDVPKLPEIILCYVPKSNPPSTSQDTSSESLEIADDLHYLITDEEPPESYWKEMAVRMQEALENTLYENAKLCDEIEVLQATNSQLLTLVRSAEELALYVNNFILRKEQRQQNGLNDNP